MYVFVYWMRQMSSCIVSSSLDLFEIALIDHSICMIPVPLYLFLKAIGEPPSHIHP